MDRLPLSWLVGVFCVALSMLVASEGLFILSWMLVASGSLQIEYCVVYLDWSWSLSVVLFFERRTVCQLSFSAPGLVLGHFFIFWDLCQLLDSFNSFALAFIVQLVEGGEEALLCRCAVIVNAP